MTSQRFAGMVAALVEAPLCAVIGRFVKHDPSFSVKMGLTYRSQERTSLQSSVRT